MEAPDSTPPTAAAGGPRTRPLEETPALAQQAAALLRTPKALVALTEDDARLVIPYMRLVSFAAGATVFREGDDAGTSYLLLLLEGEVSVDAGQHEQVPISVLGAGSIIGEMALLDGAPRSASCTAISAVRAAGLSRRGLELLIDEHPKVAARLMAGLGQRIADRLRALGEQLQLYVQINDQLRAEIAALKQR